MIGNKLVDNQDKKPNSEMERLKEGFSILCKENFKLDSFKDFLNEEDIIYQKATSLSSWVILCKIPKLPRNERSISPDKT